MCSSDAATIGDQHHCNPNKIVQKKYLTGVKISSQLRADNIFSGKTCPFPGRLPHGNWTCEMQDIPIHSNSFLDEDGQSYPGKLLDKIEFTKLFPHLY